MLIEASYLTILLCGSLDIKLLSICRRKQRRSAAGDVRAAETTTVEQNTTREGINMLSVGERSSVLSDGETKNLQKNGFLVSNFNVQEHTHKNKLFKENWIKNKNIRKSEFMMK